MSVSAVAMSLWMRVDNGSRFADLDLPCVLVSRALLTVCHSSISWCLKRLWVSRAACSEGKGVGTTLRPLWLTCGGVVSASLGWGLLSCPACSPWLKHVGPACPLVTAPPYIYCTNLTSLLLSRLPASLSLSIPSLSLSFSISTLSPPLLAQPQFLRIVPLNPIGLLGSVQWNKILIRVGKFATCSRL